MLYYLIINDVELDFEFNSFDETISNYNDITTKELIVSYDTMDDNNISSVLKANLELARPFLEENSISTLKIVDENKNILLETSEYSFITNVSKSGNASGNPSTYNLSFRFMRNL